MGDIYEPCLRRIKESHDHIKGFRKVSKGKPAYKILYYGSLSPTRLDILDFHDKTCQRQQLAADAGCTIFPEIITLDYILTYKVKQSAWVEGPYFDDLHKQGKLEGHMLEKLGEQMAQLNNISNENGHYLHNDDITMRNMLWDGEKAVVFDMDRLWWEDNPDNSYVKILLKRLVKKEYIDSFLKGYSRFRDVSNITQLCESRNWKWKR